MATNVPPRPGRLRYPSGWQDVFGKSPAMGLLGELVPAGRLTPPEIGETVPARRVNSVNIVLGSDGYLLPQDGVTIVSQVDPGERDRIWLSLLPHFLAGAVPYAAVMASSCFTEITQALLDAGWVLDLSADMWRAPPTVPAPPPEPSRQEKARAAVVCALRL